MKRPFTFDEFLEMLERFNTDWWPAHVIMYALAAAAIFLAIRKTSFSGSIVTAIHSLFWIWIGIVFNLLYFSKLYNMAYLFVVLFVLEGIILARVGILRKNLTFGVRADLCGVTGAIMIIYALIGYPIIGYATGRGPDHLLYAGMMPCPTAIFTLGMLLWTEKPLPKIVPVIPVVYALSGFVPVKLGVVEDVGLVVAGVVTGFLLLYREKVSQLDKKVPE
jgi:Family of unknown function (DUF6064)